jgi:pimeloyl-ACP methyl ester carboxylesterase
MAALAYHQSMRFILVAVALSLAASLPAGELPGDVVVDIERPPGRMIDVGGHRLHLYCRGQGQPTVIFDAGLGGFSMDWIFVQALLEGEVQVCAYDRAGYGWSDSGPAPRDSDSLAGELAALLRNSGLSPPYVLVGHSFGGYNVELFAKLHPHDVAGLVLVESSHPEQAERMPQPPSGPRRPGRQTLVTFFNPSVVFEHYPEEYWFPIGGLMASGKAVRAQQREFSNFEVSAGQVRMGGALPHVPLVVVTRGLRVWPDTALGDAQERVWSELQQELTLSVPGGRQIIAWHSGHLVHLDEPDMVARAVRLVLRDHCGARLAAAPAVQAPVLSC